MMHLWKDSPTLRVFVHSLQRQSPWFSAQNFGCSAAVSRQDCHPRCNHTQIQRRPTQCTLTAWRVSAWLPADDEGGARAGLSSSRRHPAGTLDTGNGGRDQAVDVRVDVQSQVAVLPSDVHQHDGIAKVQKAVICYGYIHLKTHSPFSSSSSSSLEPLCSSQIQVTGLRMLYLR